MSDLKEEHVDAFFLEGDAGTYEGGPTLTPVGFGDVETDEATRGPTPEQIVRRERYTRMVKKLVGSLAAASLVLFAFRAGRATDKDDAATTTNAAYVAIDRPMPAVTKAPAVVAAAPAEPSPKAEPAVVAPAPEAVVEPAPAVVAAAPAEPAAKNDSHEAAKTAALAETSSAHSAARPAPHHAESRTAHLDASSKASPSKTSSSDESLHGAVLRPAIVTTTAHSLSTNGHAPPTATFPD